MNVTLRHIEYLTTRHDCVIVPGLGAVLAHWVPAHENVDTGEWYAPGRNYSFNSALTHSDGLLAGSVARALGVSHQRALEMIQTDVAAMQSQLAVDGRLTLGRVGTLTLDEENLISFEPAPEDMLTPLASWRSTWRAQRKAADAQPPETAVHETVGEHRGVVLDMVKRMGRVAAAVVVVVGVSLALTTPVSVEDTQYAALGMPKAAVSENADGTRKTHAAVNVAATATSAHAVASTRGVNDDDTLRADGDAHPADALRMRDSDTYCLVIASMTTRGGAEKFIAMERKQHPGLDMDILEQKGRFHIYAATGNSREDVLALARTPRFQRYKGAWATRR